MKEYISSSTVTVMSCSRTNGVCYNASTEYNNVSVSTDPVNNAIVYYDTTCT